MLFFTKIFLNFSIGIITNYNYYCILFLYYGLIDVPEEKDINKGRDWHQFEICHYSYYLNINFNFQPCACMQWQS